MRTSSPALNTNTFAQFRDNLESQTQAEKNQMTVQGAVNRTGVLLLVCFGSATWTWSTFYQAIQLYGVEAGFSAVMPYLGGGVLGGLLLALVTIFKKEWAMVTAPLYALCEGFFLGGISAAVELYYSGIALQAATATLGVLLAMLALYTTRVIKVDNKMMMIIASATFGIFMVYMANWVLGIFGVSIPFIHSSGPMGIVFSLAVVVIAALNLLMDFKLIEDGAKAKAPKFMEWYSAFALMVTLVWLYVEILNLLSKLRDR